MKRDKTRTRLRWMVIPLLLGLVGFVSAKYVTTIEKEYTVTFTADLAETFVLQEHEAIRNDDGSYKLATQKNTTDGEEKLTTDGQSYELIPGLDIPKDPHIVITDKSEIPAYLYIEIVEDVDTMKVDNTDVKLISYGLTTNWMPVPSDWNPSNPVTPKHGGIIYIYKGDSNTPVKLVKDSTDPSASTNYTIPILHDKVYVSQHVKHINTNGTSDLLTFYAYLIEAVD